MCGKQRECRTRARAIGLAAALLALLGAACPSGDRQTLGSNPAAPGFDVEGSDGRAIAVADRTMRAMGGRQAWDAARYFGWNYLGRRHYLWDKRAGLVRLESLTANRPTVVIWNTNTRSGRAWIDGELVTSTRSLSEMIGTAHEDFVNDSYWLFMPYKLKDTGVTLKYVGHREMMDGRMAEVLQLTFKEVGLTPQNKFWVYVAENSNLIEQWDVYGDARDPEPSFRTPWRDWMWYGSVLLSGDRGDRALTDIAVFSELPPHAFETAEPVEAPAPAVTDAPAAR